MVPLQFGPEKRIVSILLAGKTVLSKLFSPNAYNIVQLRRNHIEDNLEETILKSGRD